jgi:RNA polymerase sigma factor for flagellar operon FliA
MLATDLLEGTATLSSADAAAAVGDDVELDVVLAEALSQGVDAERLCSAVIHYESHFHIGLVWLEANRMAPSFPDHTAEDLAGWGWLGLRVALRKFEPQRGHRFSTYACYRIKGAIRDGVRDEHPVPKRLLTLQRKVQATEEQLSVHLGRVPQLAEVAEHLGETLEHLTRILPRLANAASLDELEAAAAERGGAVPGSVDPTDPADLVIEAERLDAVRAALGTIDPGDAEAVRLLVCEERSMAEARRVTGLSDRELRRRSERGCAQLRHLLADWAHAG